MRPTDFAFLMKYITKERLALLGVIALATFLTVLPHIGYRFPIHVDEWVRLTAASEIMRGGDVAYVEPYLRGGVVRDDLEIGFAVWLAAISQVSGIPLLWLPLLLPSLILVAIIIGAYALGNYGGRRYGLAAALFVAIIPTTLRFLGPKFLVPSSLSLLFVPATLLLLTKDIELKTSMGLSLLLIATLLVHPLTAGLLFGLILVATLLRTKRIMDIALGIEAIALANLFILPRWLTDLGARVKFEKGHYLPFFSIGNWLPTAWLHTLLFFHALRISVRSFLAGAKDFAVELSIAAALICLAVAVFVFQLTDFGLWILYDRAFLYGALLAAILSGLAFHDIIKRASAIRIAGFVLLSLFLLTSVASHYNESYYRVIDEKDFVALQKISGIKGNVVLLESWQALAVPLLTNKTVYSRLPQAPDPFLTARSDEAEAFIKGACADSEFLKTRRVDIIYAPQGCLSAELEEIAPGTGVFVRKKNV